MLSGTHTQITTCLALTKAISKTRTVQEIYGAALDALQSGLGVDRSSILLFDADANLQLGTAHLASYTKRYGALPRVLAAYNAGGSRLTR